MDNPLDDIIARDPRFKPEAYAFIHDAISHTWSRLSERRHVTGQELCEGCRELALSMYGPMAKAVLNSWGVRSTDDFGSLVYNMIDAGLMSKTDEDSIQDFHAVYDFDDALVTSYNIESAKPDA